MRFRSFWFALLFSVVAGVSLAEERSVQLLLPSRQLDSTSTFELRFPNEMVPQTMAGKVAPVSPLVFSPSIDGKFIWLSTRSGTFTPKGVLPLGVKYQISLRSGLKDLAGRALFATIKELAETPPMRVKGVSSLTYRSSDDAPAMPRYLILFNANVKASACAKFIRFVNASGAKIEALVGQAGDEKNQVRPFSSYQSDDRSLAIWGEPPASPSETNANEFGDETVEKENAAPPRKNVLVVSPAKPLPPGKGWKLMIDAGLPASEWKVSLAVKKEVEVGDVQPFEASRIGAESNRIAGRRVLIDFSKTLSEEVTPESVSHWITIAPKPDDLKAEIVDKTITFKGKFDLGLAYKVTINPGLAAREPFKLLRMQSTDIKFEPIAPRLYFEDFATHQHLAGTRQFRLLAVNVPRIRVTARLFTGDTTAVAMKAYDDYDEAPDDAGDEVHSRIDVDKLQGKVIWDHELTADAGVDKQQTLPLNWDEILGAEKTGSVLLTAESIDPVTEEHKRVGTQAVIQLTDIGAVWKRGSHEMSVHFFSLTKGHSLSGVKIRLLDSNTKAVADGEATTDGNATIPVESGYRWLFAERGDDVHLISVNNSEASVPYYRLGIDEFGEGEVEAKSVYLFTERGVYKPGDVVHLKGFARSLESDRSSIPAGKKVKLTVTDPKEREFLAKEITLSEFGSFVEEITLGAETLGRYRISISGESEERLTGNGSFQVQQYRPNAFEVTIPAPPTESGPVQWDLAIAAKYFMGKPLVKGKLTWSLVARDNPFNPERLDDFAFCNAINDFRLNRALDRISQFNAQGDVEVSPDGVAKVVTALPINPKAPQPRSAKLLCEVTDLTQQTVSESRSFVQQSSDYYFGFRRLDGVFKQGAKIPIEMIAVGSDGKALTAPTTAKVRLKRITWQTNRLAAAGDTAEFNSKAQISDVWERDLSTKPGLGTDRKPMVAELNDIVADKPGEYLLEASGKDSRGHEILTSITFEVAGPSETVWNYRNPYAIDLVTDKDSYEPGQTATVLVKTPIAGDALVTVERDTVLRSFVTHLTGNSPSIQVPVMETDAPNVYVSVMLLRGANDSPRKIKTPEYRIGYCELVVARPKDRLTVQLKPSVTPAKPGDKIELVADVRDLDGSAVADAEVVLYAVDEGVLSLTDYKTPDPLAFFNQKRPLGVSTSLTLPTLLKEDADETDFANKGYLIGDGKGGPNLLDGLRKNFLACAFWNATLHTDAQGHIRVEFVAPDSLTRYRVIAVAATKKNQFGSAESAFEINKPVMIEASIPRFANFGDKLILRGVVHNNTDLTGEVEVELQLDATAKVQGETKRRITLPAHGSLPVDFPTDIVAVGKAQWRWIARFTATDGKTEFRDALQSEVNVEYPVPLLREVETKRVETDQAELKRVADPQIMEGTGEAIVEVANSRVLELRESLKYLLEYPYGCVEQTTSSLLPWLLVRDLSGTLTELAKSDAEIAKSVNHGIDLLMSMQTSDGGLSFWPGGNKSFLWGSAYAGLALAIAEKQKFSVPEAETKKLYSYLSGELRGMAKDATGYKLSAQCLAVYALAVAGKPEPAYHDLLFQKRAKLSAEDRALVALAVIESKGAKAMIDELLRPMPSDEVFVDQFFGSVSRENALHLLALTVSDPKSPHIDELAVELFKRRSNGHWGTTQANAWSLLALASYLRQIETGDKNATGQIIWAQANAPFSVSKEKPVVSTRFPIVNKTAAEPISVTKSGGKIFTEVTVEAKPKLIERPRQNRGYTINRRYSKLGDDGKLSAASSLRVGDRVLITLDIEVPTLATYLAVDDPLPGVFEAINPAFASQEVVAGETLGTEWVSDYSELRQDRAVFFIDYLYPGRYTLRYLARVISAGEATAPSAKIEEMYHPDRFGLTETMHVRSEGLK